MDCPEPRRRRPGRSSSPATTGSRPALPAITGNLTVTGPDRRRLRRVTDTAIDQPPTTSTINFPLGDTRGQRDHRPPGRGTGALWFVYEAQAGKHVQLILDITGYFE